MKVLRNKKGAALVSVLIGILFIAILASSLLYMSTMNYQMKSMHQFSMDNFYSAEYALDDMLAQLKQYNSIQSNPHDGLESLLKKDGGGGRTVFNEAALMNLIDLSYVEGLDMSFGHNGVEISTIYTDINSGAYTQDTYVEDGNYIHLRGVQITVKTDEAHGNYKSTITTDIDFGFPNRGGSSAGLNDFSVLTDSCIRVNGGSQHFCGDMYCKKNGRLTEHGLDCALQIDDHSIVSMLGGFCFLDGDIYVKNGGSLYIAGNCYVKGQIYVEPQGQVQVGGKLYARGSGDAGGGTPRAIGGGQVHLNDTTVDWDYYDINFSTGLANRLLANEIHFHLDSAHTSMEYFNTDCHGFSDDFTFTQSLLKTVMQAGTNDTGKKANGTFTDYNGNDRDVHAWYMTNGVNHDISDTLILSPIGTTSFHGNTYNCTWVCTCNDGCMSIGESGGTAQNLNIWGNMDDASYEAAKKLFFQAQMPSDLNLQFGGQGLSTDDLVPVGGASADTIGTEFTLGTETVKYYTHGNSLGQKYYYQSGVGGNAKKNYIPFECFLDDQLEITLGEFRNGLVGEGTTDTRPSIYINNWTKE